MEWWKDESVCRQLSHWFCKHIVCLQMTYQVNQEEHSNLFTGFLLKYKGLHLWLTAGHILEEIENIYKSDDYKVRGIAWADNHSTYDAKAVPTVFDRLEKYLINNKDGDVGVINLKGLDLENILACEENIWMDEDMWKYNHLAKPKGYYLVGLPCETNEDKTIKRDDGFVEGSISGYAFTIPVQRIDRKDSQDDFWNYQDAFYGELTPVTKQQGGQLNSIEGMSGGFIISIEGNIEKQNLLYRLYAIQSSWLPESKIIRATPMEVVESILDEASSNFQDRD